MSGSTQPGSASASFVPPSPGAWELEQTHITKPQSLFLIDTIPGPMMQGFRDGTRAYGILLDYLEVAVINRFVYLAPRPVGAPKSSRGLPPRAVFGILRRVHPEIRRRIRQAPEVFRTRAWRRDVQQWDEELRPKLLAEGRRLAAVDLSAASDAQLADHVREATEFLRTATYTHHRLNFCAMLPVGDFLVHAMQWTGLSAGELLQTMRGLSPVSAGAIEELQALRRAILESPDANALVRSNTPADEIVSALLARTDAVGSAARAYMDGIGPRVLGGYDVADRYAREHPELIVKIVRSAVGSDDRTRQAAAEESVAAIRAKVPGQHQAQFDDLLAEARRTYRIRDERIFHGDALATGIARRAILAAGDRLQARGRVVAAEDLLDARSEEIAALLEGRPAPSAEELSERARWRRETPLSAAPPHLGFPKSPPLPAEWLPGDAARLHRVVTLTISLLFDVPPRSPEPQQLKGFPVSPGVYEGPVRVIQDVDELATVQRGEVLVATSTGPTFNVVLPLIGALVTERGGVLSHAAIVSREYGLPGVVGCAGAASVLKTGMRVRVDGTTGEIWMLS